MKIMEKYTRDFANDPSSIGNIDVKNGDNIVLYPNPVKDILKVNSEEVIQSIVVYNMMGQKVYETAVHNMQAEINVSVLDAGYYVLKMTKGDGSTVARKITKM